MPTTGERDLYSTALGVKSSSKHSGREHLADESTSIGQFIGVSFVPLPKIWPPIDVEAVSNMQRLLLPEVHKGIIERLARNLNYSVERSVQFHN
jgi:hypothetical protein